MTLLYINLALILFNVANSYFDAYKILKAQQSNTAKTIKHGINFGLYLALVIGLKFAFNLNWVFEGIFAFSAFFNRQITFDIPLNWRRHLDWDYVSLDNPPKALMDRIEVRIFGYDGKKAAIFYICMLLTTLAGQVAFYINHTIN